ncbi:hypothetical protein [Pedobacter panaciterrae]|uniref:SprB-like repeat protein n=1 Tax=Pedobacter panaciterrae TaxID=363849 RepID=A0ABU8NGD3_9SPHI|nr:hypothetical protein [Pedobacter panaciterrae]NQX57081.1 hypothetical protein [Pedobacter panaciterrae]
MKTKITFLKMSFLLASFLITSTSAMAATFYTCSGTTLNLGVTNLPAGTSALWDVKKDGTQFAGYPSATAPTSFTDPGSYEVILVSQTDAASGQCSSDPVSNTIIILPPLAFSLNAPSVPAYCQSNNTVNSSDITQTGAALSPVSGSDLVLEYTYSVNNGTTTVDGSTVGTIDQATGKFTLTTTTPGVYVITGKVKYKQATTFTNTLLGTGCEVTATTTQTVTVTQTPGQPTVTITAP